MGTRAPRTPARECCCVTLSGPDDQSFFMPSSGLHTSRALLLTFRVEDLSQRATYPGDPDASFTSYSKPTEENRCHQGVIQLRKMGQLFSCPEQVGVCCSWARVGGRSLDASFVTDGLCVSAQETIAVIERFGKFDRMAAPGFNCVQCYIGEKVSGTVSLRVRQLEVSICGERSVMSRAT